MLVGGCILSGAGFADTSLLDGRVETATRMRINADYGKLPIAFEANRGQTAAAVRFLARGHGYALFLTPTEAVLRTRATPNVRTETVVRMRLAGSNRNPDIVGADVLPGTSNYFIGNDPGMWRQEVPQYAKVRYANVYPGIDLVYYGNQHELEYDFVVAPGANPERIAFEFNGANRLALDVDGNLVVSTANGSLLQHKPVVYQDVDGARQKIDGRYVLHGKRRVSFQVARYDASHPLIIDPTIVYSTYLIGADGANAIAVDSSNNAYITASTFSATFPLVHAYQTTNYNAYRGQDTVYVTKFNADGTQLLYSTYLGGSGCISAYHGDVGAGIAVDDSGNAYVTGYTCSSNFPTVNAYQSTDFGAATDANNAFVAKLNTNASGTASLVYSSYLGGSSGGAQGIAIAVDTGGKAYVTGSTTSTNFPTTVGAFQTSAGNSFVAKFDTTRSGVASLVYSTYLGVGAYAYGIAVDGSGNAYVTGATDAAHAFPTTSNAYQTTQPGRAAFVAKLNASATQLLYSTYLGGSMPAGSANDVGYGIAVDSSGNAYATGYSISTNFPTVNAFQPMYPGTLYFGNYTTVAFVSKLNTNASGVQSLVYSTYLGGSNYDYGRGIAVRGGGQVYVTGYTSSTDFPIKNAFQPTYGGPALNGSDAFMAKLDTTKTGARSLLDSTYLGGNGGDTATGIAIDVGGNAYVAGYTNSSNFPTTSGAYQTTNGSGASAAFVTKFPVDDEIFSDGFELVP